MSDDRAGVAARRVVLRLRNALLQAARNAKGSAASRGSALEAVEEALVAMLGLMTAPLQKQSHGDGGVTATVLDTVRDFYDIAEKDAGLCSAATSVGWGSWAVTTTEALGTMSWRHVAVVADMAGSNDEAFKAMAATAGLLRMCTAYLVAAHVLRSQGVVVGVVEDERSLVQVLRLLGNLAFGSGRGSSAAAAKNAWLEEATASSHADDTAQALCRFASGQGRAGSAASIIRWASHALGNLVYGGAPNLAQALFWQHDAEGAIAVALQRVASTSSSPFECPWQVVTALAEAWFNLCFRFDPAVLPLGSEEPLRTVETRDGTDRRAASTAIREAFHHLARVLQALMPDDALSTPVPLGAPAAETAVTRVLRAADGQVRPFGYLTVTDQVSTSTSSKP